MNTSNRADLFSSSYRNAAVYKDNNRYHYNGAENVHRNHRSDKQNNHWTSSYNNDDNHIRGHNGPPKLPQPPPYAVTARIPWYAEPMRRSDQAFINDTKKLKKGPCDVYLQRYIKKPIAKAIFMSLLPNVQSKWFLHKWEDTMRNIFRVVHRIDGMEREWRDRCTADEIELFRDAVRYTIKRCPYPHLRKPPPM